MGFTPAQKLETGPKANPAKREGAAKRAHMSAKGGR